MWCATRLLPAPVPSLWLAPARNDAAGSSTMSSGTVAHAAGMVTEFKAGDTTDVAIGNDIVSEAMATQMVGVNTWN